MTKDLAARIAAATAGHISAAQIANLAEAIRNEAAGLSRRAEIERRLAADEAEEPDFRARARVRADVLAWRARSLADALPTLAAAYDAARPATPAALAA